MKRLCPLCFLILLVVTSASAADKDLISEGKSLVTRNCSRCHAIGKEEESPLAEAPPLREIYLRYPIEQFRASGEERPEGKVGLRVHHDGVLAAVDRLQHDVDDLGNRRARLEEDLAVAAFAEHPPIRGDGNAAFCRRSVGVKPLTVA